MTPPDSGEHEVPAFKRAFNETMERTGHHVSIPLPLAQRILAALEDIATQEVRAIRAELRERLPR